MMIPTLTMSSITYPWRFLSKEINVTSEHAHWVNLREFLIADVARNEINYLERYHKKLCKK